MNLLKLLKLKNRFRMQDDFKNLIDSSSVTQKYILLQNQCLQDEVDSLRNKLFESEKVCQEQENDLEQMEKSKVYMKGLLQNFNEIQKFYNRLDNANINLLKRQKIDQSLNLHKSKKQLYSLSIGLVLFLSFLYNIVHIFEFLFVFTYTSTMLFVNYNHIQLLIPKTPKKETTLINELRTAIGEAESSQDYIHELIDCQ